MKTLMKLTAVVVTLIFALQMSAFAKTVETPYAYYDDTSGALVAGGVSPFGEGTVATIGVDKDGALFCFNFATTGAGGTFSFKCPFDPQTDSSGTYKVTLGGAALDAATPIDVVFVNATDTGRILGEIKDSTGNTLYGVLTSNENKDLICVDLLGDITLLSDTAAVYTALAGKTYASVPAFERAFAAAVAVARFNESTAAQGEALLAAYADALGTDTALLFDNIKTAELKADVYGAVCFKNIELTAQAFCEEFDKACYTALFNGLDSSDRDKLITYLTACNTAGYTAADIAAYNTISGKNDRADVIKNVIAAKNETKFENLKSAENAFNEEVKKKTAPTPDPAPEEEGERVITISGGGGGGGTKKPAATTTEPPATATPETDEKTEESPLFDDLGTVAWATEAIEALARDGVTNGVGNNKFNPDGYVTREEFVKLLAAGLKLPSATTKNTFADVAEGEWFYEPVMNAYALGIVRGVDFDLFGTGGKITREQLCTFVYRAMLVLDATIEVDDMNTAIADRDAISEYALDAVEAMYRAGIVSGMGDGSFAPGAYATRAQAAKIIYEVRERIG